MHALQKGHAAIAKHLAFRDYLRAHAEVAKSYQELKQRLVTLPDATRENYQERKQEFIAKTVLQAMEWYQENSAAIRQVRKAVVYAVRGENFNEVLVFNHVKHPEVSPQVPSGTIEEKEDPRQGALRELLEESGINLEASRLSLLGSYTYYKSQLRQLQERFVFIFDGSDLPERWLHRVTGNGVDQDL